MIPGLFLTRGISDSWVILDPREAGIKVFLDPREAGIKGVPRPAEGGGILVIPTPRGKEEESWLFQHPREARVITLGIVTFAPESPE